MTARSDSIEQIKRIRGKARSALCAGNRHTAAAGFEQRQAAHVRSAGSGRRTASACPVAGANAAGYLRCLKSI